jgi:hypothetical protein
MYPTLHYVALDNKRLFKLIFIPTCTIGKGKGKDPPCTSRRVEDLLTPRSRVLLEKKLILS